MICHGIIGLSIATNVPLWWKMLYKGGSYTSVGAEDMWEIYLPSA